VLNWFPTPYPGELWYSVLCRFYISTGIREASIVKKLLFRKRGNIKMATLFPNASVHLVTSRLPPNTLDPKNIILENTPFPYYVRMYSASEKKSLLEDLANGRGQRPTHLWRAIPKDGYSLRYCPLCVKDDNRKYGEPYYHVEHQIPLSSVCVRHRCRLKQIESHNPNVALNQGFFPLSLQDVDDTVDEDPQPYEYETSRLVWEYLRLPFSVGPTIGYNNLYQTVLNRDFLEVCRQTGVVVDKEKLYNALREHYGPALTESVFGKSITTCKINRIRGWEQLLPDRYILIQALLGMKTRDVFGDEPVEDVLRTKVQKLADEGRFTTLKELSSRMDCKQYQVIALFRQYGFNPTWRELPKGKERLPKTGLIRCTVDETELQEIEQFARELGYRGAGPFALDCVRYVMEQRKEKEQ